MFLDSGPAVKRVVKTVAFDCDRLFFVLYIYGANRLDDLTSFFPYDFIHSFIDDTFQDAEKFFNTKLVCVLPTVDRDF